MTILVQLAVNQVLRLQQYAYKIIIMMDIRMQELHLRHSPLVTVVVVQLVLVGRIQKTHMEEQFLVV